MTLRHLALAAVCVAFAAPPAYADIMFTAKDTGGIGEVNILFKNNDTGTPIVGTISGTSNTVDFSSLTGQSFLGGGNGQALIQAEPNPGNTLMTSIDMKAQAGTAWTDVIIDMDDAGNPCGGGQGTCGVAKVTALDQMGHSFNTTLSNGTNFVTMVAGPDPITHIQEFITDVQVTEVSPDPTTGNFGWTDFKQPRVSGLCTVTDAATGSCTPVQGVPEPRSLVLLFGALLGFLVVRRLVPLRSYA